MRQATPGEMFDMKMHAIYSLACWSYLWQKYFDKLFIYPNFGRILFKSKHKLRAVPIGFQYVPSDCAVCLLHYRARVLRTGFFITAIGYDLVIQWSEHSSWDITKLYRICVTKQSVMLGLSYPIFRHTEYIVPRLEGPTMHPPPSPDPPRVVSFCAGAPSEWKITCHQ
jgi:hypothetical protein